MDANGEIVLDDYENGVSKIENASTRKRKRTSPGQDVNPPAKRITRSSSNITKKLDVTNEVAAEVPAVQIISQSQDSISSSPTAVHKSQSPLKLKITASKCVFTSTEVAPKPLEHKIPDNESQTNKPTSWSSILTGKPETSSKSDKKSSSPPRSTSPVRPIQTSEVIEIESEISLPSVPMHPFFQPRSKKAAIDPNQTVVSETKIQPETTKQSNSGPLHPFFMSKEEKKQKAVLENEAKLRSMIEKRREDIRLLNGGSEVTPSAFFAPKQNMKKNGDIDRPQSTFIRPIEWESYGTNCPEFPIQQSHVRQIEHESMLETVKNDRLDFNQDDQDLLDPEKEFRNFERQRREVLGEFASFIGIHSKQANQSCDSIESSKILKNDSSSACIETSATSIETSPACIDTSPTSIDRSPTSTSPDSTIEHIEQVSMSIFQGQNEIISKLGLRKHSHSTNLTPLVEKRPLFDIPAEEMGEYVAQQQKAAAQMKAIQESIMLSKGTEDDPYDLQSIKELLSEMSLQVQNGSTQSEKSNIEKSNLPWTSKYAPTNTKQVCGNKIYANFLYQWLEKWKAESQRSSSDNSVTKVHDFFKPTAKRSTSKGSLSASAEVTGTTAPSESLCNTFIVSGPIGSGKTSAIYAIAKELGYGILEVNASVKRSSSSLKNMVEEATQSRHVGRKNEGLTVLLFEEVDQIFLPEDTGFYNALLSLSETTKRPIIITCNEIPKILESKMQKAVFWNMKPPDEASIFVHASLICALENKPIPNPKSIIDLSKWFNYDFRAIVNHLQLSMSNDYGGFVNLQKMQGPFNFSHLTKIFYNSSFGDLKYDLNPLWDYSYDVLTSGNHYTIADLKAVARLSELLSVSSILRSNELNEVNTSIETSNEILATWHALLWLTVKERFESSSKVSDLPTNLEPSVSIKYALLGLTQSVNRKNMDSVAEMMLQPTSMASSQTRLDYLFGLRKMIEIDDFHRFENVKRRAYKSRFDWESVGIDKKNIFMNATSLTSWSSQT